MIKSMRLGFALGATVVATLGAVGDAAATPPLAGEAAVVGEPSAYRECPAGTVIRVSVGIHPPCDLTSANRLDIFWLGSDGIEQRYFRRLCNRRGGRLHFVLPGGDINRGRFECWDIDF